MSEHENRGFVGILEHRPLLVVAWYHVGVRGSKWEEEVNL